MYKTVIFDLDGTLLDTLEDLMNSVNYALASFGLPERSYGEIRDRVGHGIRNLVDRSVPDGTDAALTDRVFGCFKEHYQLHCTDKTAPYPGVNDLMIKLKNEGIRIGIISNKADPAVRELVPVYFDGLVDIARGELPGVPKKPAPDGVLRMMDEFGAKPEETVYVGDSDVDLATAVNSGIDHVIVTWGFRDREFLIGRGARVLADTADEVYAIVTA